MFCTKRAKLLGAIRKRWPMCATSHRRASGACRKSEVTDTVFGGRCVFQIIKGRLYIGNRAQAQSWTLLQSLSATHIVNVCRDACAPFEGVPSPPLCRVPTFHPRTVVPAHAHYGSWALAGVRWLMQEGPACTTRGSLLQNA
jgi:hypothetical protein